MFERPLVFVMRVQRRNPGKRCRVSRMRQVFVVLQADRHSNFAFRRWTERIVSQTTWLHDPQHMAAATDAHAFAQRDLRRHIERELEFGPLCEDYVRQEEYALRTQILREAKSFRGAVQFAESQWKKIREPLPNPAFNSNWRSGHK